MPPAKLSKVCLRVSGFELLFAKQVEMKSSMDKEAIVLLVLKSTSKFPETLQAAGAISDQK